MGSAARGEANAAEDDEVAFEVCKTMALSLTHLGHLFELLSFLMASLDVVDLDGFADHLLGVRNINPKDACNPKWAYLVATPEFARIAPPAAHKLESNGVAARVRARASSCRPTTLSSRHSGPRPSWAR